MAIPVDLDALELSMAGPLRYRNGLEKNMMRDDGYVKVDHLLRACQWTNPEIGNASVEDVLRVSSRSMKGNQLRYQTTGNWTEGWLIRATYKKKWVSRVLR